MRPARPITGRRQNQSRSRPGNAHSIKGNSDANLCRHGAGVTLLVRHEQPSNCAILEQLQGMQRSAAGLYEELCRSDLQNRISDVHEVVPKEIAAHVISNVRNNGLEMTDIPAGQKVADQEIGHGITFGEAFRVWLRVAVLSFGGPAGQIAVMHRILVEEKNWISESRFLHALNYCMLLPGPEAQQLATYIGWLLHRTAGGIMAGGLFILPGVIAIMGLSYIYAAFGKVGFVEALFFGLKAAVLAIVIQAVVRVGKRALRNRIMIALAAIAFIAIFFFAVPFPIIIIGAGVIGYVGAKIGRPEFAAVGHGGGGKKTAAVDSLLGEKLPEHVRPSVGRALRVSSVWLLLWLVPVAALLIGLGQANVFSQIALFFSKMAMVTFGGAYAVLVYVAQQAVEHYHWVQPREMLDGLGMAETTPGPLIMVLQFVGFMAAYRDPGALSPMLAATLGGLLATWVTFTPCFLWIFLGAPFIETLRGNKGLAGALTAITAAVVGVILNLSVDMPVWSSLDVAALVLAVAAAAAIFRFNMGMLTVLAGSCAAGVLLRLVG